MVHFLWVLELLCVYLYLHLQDCDLLRSDLELVRVALEVEALDRLHETFSGFLLGLALSCLDEGKLDVRVKVRTQILEGNLEFLDG